MLSVAHLNTGVPCCIFHDCLYGLVNEQTQKRGNEEEIHNFPYFILEQEQTVRLLVKSDTDCRLCFDIFICFMP